MRIRGNPALASGCFRPHGCLQADGLVRHGASVAEPVERFKHSLLFRAMSDEITSREVDARDRRVSPAAERSPAFEGAAVGVALPGVR